jgi:hypothetical protein
LGSHLGCRFVVLAALVMSPLAATAQPVDKAGAEALFEQARKLMDAKRFAEACEKFAASHKLEPAVGTLLNLAECNERQDHLATAWAYYREAQALAQSRADGDRERYARDHAQGLEPKLAKLTLIAKNVPSGLELKKDGLPIGAAVLGTPLPIDVGTHAVEATAPGRKRWSSNVEVPRDGAKVSVEVPTLEEDETAQRDQGQVTPPVPTGPSTTPEKPTKPPKTPKPPREEQGLGVQRTSALVAGGVGVVALGFGGFFAARAWSNWQDARPHCNASNVCDDTGFDLGQTARQQGDVATAAFITGGLALAIGAVLWLTAPTADKSSGRAAPIFGVARAGAGGVFVGRF